MNKELFLNGYIEKIATKFDIAKDLAFEILCLSSILDMSFDEVYDEASTLENKDGSHDGGFDGIYIDKDENILHIFQMKNKPTIGDNELTKFISNYENIFVRNNSAGIRLNKTVKAKVDEYISLIQNGEYFEVQLYFIFNGTKETTNKSQNLEVSQRFEAAQENLKILDSDDLFSRIESLVTINKKRKQHKFTFQAEKSNISLKNDPQALISFSLLNVKAANFRLEALEICKLIDREIEINKSKDTLFSDNIRGYLGTNKTNRSIRDTLLSEDAEYFPFLNNGITIIANRINMPKQMMVGYYPIESINPVIVNGLQTTNVLYDIYKRDSSRLEGVYVMVRLYETADAELIDKITNATNTQSPISFRDKISTKRFNDFTKELFESKGVGYLTKRGETFDNTLSKQMHESITNETVIKFWYATFFEKPTIARSSKSKVMEYCFTAVEDAKHPLHKLFNGDKNSSIYMQLFIAYKIYMQVANMRKSYIKEEIEDFIFYADEFMSYGIYKLLKKNELFKTFEPLLGEYYHEIFDTIKAIVESEKVRLNALDMTYSHNEYFKSERAVSDLNEKMSFCETENKIENLNRFAI